MNQSSLLFNPEVPLAIANGYGVDSWAMLIQAVKSGRLKNRKVIITFADTGSEKQSTYDCIPTLDAWLKKEAGLNVITVRYVAKRFKNWPPYYSLEDNCLTNGTLPGISFGIASCSIKWKQTPQHAYVKEWQPAQDVWAAGGQVEKWIGFDSSPADRKRTYIEEDQEKAKYHFVYPLQDLNWDRRRCMEEIQSVGLPVPPKSSCFFCMAMKPGEVDDLAISELDKLRRIVAMEARATPRIRNEGHGIWRGGVKGTRGGIKRPGRMTDYIREKKLLPAEEIQEIWDNTPADIVEYQAGFAKALEAGNVKQFLDAESAKDYRHTMD